MNARFGLGRSLGPAQTLQILRERRITIDGEDIDLSKRIAQAEEMLLNTVRSLVNDVWGSTRALYRLVFTGGGAEFLRSQLVKAYPAKQVIIPEHPVLSNARGFAKAAVVMTRAAGLATA